MAAILNDLINEIHQDGLGLLAAGKNGLQSGLGGFELGLLGFLGGLEFGEQILDLSRRGVVVQGLLERSLFRAGSAEEATTTLTATATATATALATVAVTTAAEHGAHAVITEFTTGIQNALNQGLDRRPIRVIREAETILYAFHDTLLHLGRVEISTAAAEATTAATTAVAAATLATAATATTVILREQAGRAESQRGRHRAHRKNAIQFHEFMLLVVVVYAGAGNRAHAGFQAVNARNVPRLEIENWEQKRVWQRANSAQGPVAAQELRRGLASKNERIGIGLMDVTRGEIVTDLSFLGAHFVGGDGGEDDEALDDLLPERRDVEEKEAVVEDANDEAAQNGAENGTAPAAE